MKAIGFIFARGGSKGLPRKNVKLLGGKPLITHAVEQALASTHINRVIVSTEDEEIARVAREYGAETPFMRPAELATDAAPERLAWRHAVEYLRANDPDGDFDVFVSVPAVAPLRSPEDIDACVNKLVSTDADTVFTVVKTTRSPFFNMVTLDAQANVRIAVPLDSTITRRQDAPSCWDITPLCYASRPDSILKYDTLFGGVVKAVEVPVERAFDIDTPWDFRLTELIYNDLHKRQAMEKP
jgi:N-acylneuraminate cytidylyltransferase